MRSFRDRFLRLKQSQVFYLDDCCSLARCGSRSRRGAMGDTLGTARTSDSKIQHRIGWIRSSRTVAILNILACSCFRMQPAGVEQGWLHAVLLSHSVSFWLVAPEWTPRQGPLCLSHGAATRALHAWLLESPCARSLATK